MSSGVSSGQWRHRWWGSFSATWRTCSAQQLLYRELEFPSERLQKNKHWFGSCCDNKPIAAHTMSHCSPDIILCGWLGLKHQLTLFVPDVATVAVHAARSHCSRQFNSYCKCCILLFQTPQQLLLAVYLITDDAVVAGHTVSSCSSLWNSYCSRCFISSL